MFMLFVNLVSLSQLLKRKAEWFHCFLRKNWI